MRVRLIRSPRAGLEFVNLESGNFSEVNFERFWTKPVQLWTMQLHCFYIYLILSNLQRIRHGFDSRRRCQLFTPSFTPPNRINIHAAGYTQKLEAFKC